MGVNNLILSRDRLPEATPERIIMHWTWGSSFPSSEDKLLYHVIIDGHGNRVWGTYSISDNCLPNEVFAPHTQGLSKGSIGVALAGMAGAHEHPFDAGSHPINHGQYEIGCRVAAELCFHYGLMVSERTVLTHGEVNKFYGVQGQEDWDLMVLPWQPSLTYDQAGERLRNRVRYYLSNYRISLPAAESDEDITLVVVPQSGINIRSGPNFTADVVAVVSFGTHLKSTKKSGPWYKIEGDSEGWVREEYVDFIKGQPKG